MGRIRSIATLPETDPYVSPLAVSHPLSGTGAERSLRGGLAACSEAHSPNGSAGWLADPQYVRNGLPVQQNSPEDFAVEYVAAHPRDRGRLIASYADWVVQGARAQGPWQWGFLILACSAFAMFTAWQGGVEHWEFWATSSAGACAGALASWVACRRERAWRQANPWRGRGGVR